MKKIRKTIAALLVLSVCFCVLSVAASAETVDVTLAENEEPLSQDGYTYTVVDGKATITGFNKSYRRELTIPEKLSGYTVETIGAGAFEDCERITDIVIPDCVKTIEFNAFKNCFRAKTLTIGKGVECISGGAFDRLLSMREIYFNAANCKLGSNKTPFSQLGVSKDGVTVTFGDSVISVPEFLFGCQKSDKITEPIKYNVFGNEYELDDLFASSHKFDVETLKVVRVVFGKNVATIGAFAFANCLNLQSVYFTNSITEIGEHAFSCGHFFSHDYEDSTTSDALPDFDSSILPPTIKVSPWAIVASVPLIGFATAIGASFILFMLPFAPIFKIVDYFKFAAEYKYI